MPIVRNEPLAIDAPMSSMRCTTLARSCTSRTLSGSSCASVTIAERVITRCVSTPSERNMRNAAAPYAVPDAPLIPTISRRAAWLTQNPIRNHVARCATALCNHSASWPVPGQATSNSAQFFCAFQAADHRDRQQIFTRLVWGRGDLDQPVAKLATRRLKVPLVLDRLPLDI